MIVAFLAFGIALVQVLLSHEAISSRTRFIFGIVVTILSAIPLTIQFVVLLGELARAPKYSIKLLLHRMMTNVLGSSGPASSLIIKQYSRKKLGEFAEPNGLLFMAVLYSAQSFAKLFAALVFGDAFSGVFAIRHVSVALWMDDDCEPWVNCNKTVIKEDEEDLFSKPRVKDVRDLSLTVEFSPTDLEDEFSPSEHGQSTMVHCHVLATGSRDNHVSKLYYESWRVTCPRANALELCMLLETLNNDSFIVKCRPPMKNGKILNDQILPCEDLGVIVRSILKDNKKLTACRVYGMIYV